MIEEAVRALRAIDPEKLAQAAESLPDRARTVYKALGQEEMAPAGAEEAADDPWR